MKMNIKNITTFAKSGIDPINAEISFFIPGRAFMVFKGLNILIILKDFNFTVPNASSRILKND
jgi:hypothetical protein